MYNYPKNYDVIVIGAGHAGIEAASAAARLGAQVALLTQNLDTIGQMSCNPAIGGLGKGHMVREIDALGGFMAGNTDATAIQWRLLNASKGPSVRAPRAQCDKKAYQFRAKFFIESHPNVDLHQGNVADILERSGKACGVTTSLGLRLNAQAIVLSAGTFMKGLMHVGTQNEKGGRMGDATSSVSEALKRFGIDVERFKTGTPCRLNGRSIDFSKCERQAGDTPPPLFSFHPQLITNQPQDLFTLNSWKSDQMFHVEQSPCWMTWTNETTHQIIQDNIHLSPMFSGQISGVGPRYCPSIEDKVVRFADRSRHQIFLEPEGLHTHEYYVNGVSTSLPYEVQLNFIRSIPGLENAEIIRPGYAVEYDYCPPTQLYPSLESKNIENLFLAGQVNGTSGYEEAAGQGLLAGTNAARKTQGKPPIILARHQAYLGVMVDDLVTKGCTEPYRMFTSRAEYRLLLRHDNADQRLTELGIEAGLVDSGRAERYRQKSKHIAEMTKFVDQTRHEGVALAHWFRREGNTWPKLPDEMVKLFHVEHWNLIEADYKYAGHIQRQEDEIARLRKSENTPLPAGIDYHSIRGLKKEAQQRLSEIRPATLGQAGRISGITPADLALLAIWLRKHGAQAGKPGQELDSCEIPASASGGNPTP